MIYVKIEYLDNFEFDHLKKGTQGASGFDLYACEDKWIQPGKNCIIPCGLN